MRAHCVRTGTGYWTNNWAITIKLPGRLSTACLSFAFYRLNFITGDRDYLKLVHISRLWPIGDLLARYSSNENAVDWLSKNMNNVCWIPTNDWTSYHDCQAQTASRFCPIQAQTSSQCFDRWSRAWENQNKISDIRGTSITTKRFFFTREYFVMIFIILFFHNYPATRFDSTPNETVAGG